MSDGLADSLCDTLALDEGDVDSEAVDVLVALCVIESVNVFDGVGTSVSVSVRDSVCDNVALVDTDADGVIDAEDDSDVLLVSVSELDFVLVSDSV